MCRLADSILRDEPPRQAARRVSQEEVVRRRRHILTQNRRPFYGCVMVDFRDLFRNVGVRHIFHRRLFGYHVGSDADLHRFVKPTRTPHYPVRHTSLPHGGAHISASDDIPVGDVHQLSV